MANTEVVPKDEQSLALSKDEIRKQLLRARFEGELWNRLAAEPTPDSEVEERVGSSGENYEYYTQYYCIQKLNEKFPGWEIELLSLDYVKEVRTWKMTGYLHVKYFSPLENKWVYRKIFGVGGAFVHSRADDPTVPVQPEDALKSCRTEFIKNVSYLLGIGLDVHKQAITDTMMNTFDDYISTIENISMQNYYRSIVSAFKKRMVMKNFLNNLPEANKINEVAADILAHIPQHKQEELLQKLSTQNKSTIFQFSNTIKLLIAKIKERQNNG